MHKVLTVNVLKPLLLVCRTKFNNHYKLNPPVQINLWSSANDKKAYITYITEKRFIENLEILIKHNGDILLTPEELKILVKYTEK